MSFFGTTTKSIRSTIFFLLLVGLLLTSCGGPPPEIGEPKILDPQPPVSPGTKVSITIEVISRESVTYKWDVADGCGQIIKGDTTSAIIWQAPSQPDLCNVRVAITTAGVSTEKHVAIRVEGGATDTTTPTRSVGAIELVPADFKTQDGDGDGIVDEFILDIRSKKAIPGDLTNYDLEFTFQGGDGKQVQLWYKDQGWKSVYSSPSPLNTAPIRFNPLADVRKVNEFNDFTHINAVGAKVEGGIEGVRITSARLIKR